MHSQNRTKTNTIIENSFVCNSYFFLYAHSYNIILADTLLNYPKHKVVAMVRILHDLRGD